MFEHYLLTTSYNELLKAAQAEQTSLSSELGYSVGLACVSRLNQKVSHDGVCLASDGCWVIDFRDDSDNHTVEFLLDIECLVTGATPNSTSVIALVTFHPPDLKEIHLSMGVASREGCFDVEEQSNFAGQVDGLSDLDPTKTHWYLRDSITRE